MKCEEEINMIIIVSYKRCFILKQELSAAREAGEGGSRHCFGQGLARREMVRRAERTTQSPLATRHRSSQVDLEAPE